METDRSSKTQAEGRKEKFDQQAKVCKGLAESALHDIDEALDSYSNYTFVLEKAMERGDIGEAEREEALQAYEKWINGES